MNQVIAQWEDEENNRQIQFSVEYQLENGNVDVVAVTPTKVSFICPETNSVLRTIGVHTATGRNMLAEQINNAGQIDRLKSEITERHAEIVNA